MTPSIAAVVCTYERPETIRAVLADLVAQLPAGAEIAVIDQSADPGPVRRVVEDLADARVVIHRAAPGLPAARNLGLARTRAPLVWFVDDDVLLHAGCATAVIQAFDDPCVGGIVGRIEERRVRPNARQTTNRVDWAGRVRTRLDGTRAQAIETLKGCHMAFRRQALEEAGGFDPGFDGTALLEDADASARVAELGWTLRFEPAAGVEHISAPRGGVRQRDFVATEWWRFHNTARFVRIHRGPLAAPGMALVFGAIAVRRAAEWRSPGSALRLLGALRRGWRSGRDAPAPGSLRP